MHIFADFERFNGEDGEYLYTVVVMDFNDPSDILDLVDFKTEFAAQTYADAVNLTQKVHPDA